MCIRDSAGAARADPRQGLLRGPWFPGRRRGVHGGRHRARGDDAGAGLGAANDRPAVMAGQPWRAGLPGAAAGFDAAAGYADSPDRKRKNPGRFRERGFSWRITTGTS